MVADRIGPSRRGRLRRIAVATVVVADVAMFVIAALRLEAEPLEASPLFGLIVLSFVTTGALLAIRVPSNPIGALLLAAGTLASAGAGASAYIAASIDAGGTLPGTWLAAAASDLFLAGPVTIVLFLVPLLFPTGRLLSPRWRWLVVLVVAVVAEAVIANVLRSPMLGDSGLIENPLYRPDLSWLAGVGDDFAGAASIASGIGSILATALRYRHGTPLERQQLKWLFAIVAMGLAGLVLLLHPEEEATAVAGFVVALVSIALLPIAILVAIARYRLYEIDRIVSRTLAYGTLTAILGGVYFTTFASIGAFLTSITRGGSVAVAVSTLVVFALFQPARRRIQDAMDRRFDRSRYDAARIVAAFAGRVRDAIDPDGLARELVATATATVRPSVASVWLRPRNGIRTPGA